MQSCDHPAAKLKPEEISVSDAGHLTVSFFCLGCLARITKAFLGRTPQQEESPGSRAIADIAVIGGA